MKKACYLKYREGSIIILSTLATILMVGLTAIVTDAGFAYYRHVKLQTAVNAGWKAGNDWLKKRISEQGGPATNYINEVRAKVAEVLAANGLTPQEIASATIRIVNNNLEVIGTIPSPTFFAKIFNINEFKVSASRAGFDIEQATIAPFAIPHGVVKDLSRTTYTVDFFDTNQQFATGAEYILKLGSGGGQNVNPPPQQDLKMILIPMGNGDQPNETSYLRAYGVTFWCLKIDENDPGYVPAYWLLGYRGGSFLLPYDTEIIQKCNSYGVNYTIIEGRDNIQAIFNQVNPYVLELIYRPRIAVYSSQNNPDPVELVLRTARIPYGTYSLPPTVNPNGWARNQNYSESKCNRIYDGEIIDGALSFYHWVHLHHEDFTGFCGGCSNYLKTCKDFVVSGWLGPTNNQSQREIVKSRLCSYCRNFYNTTNNTWNNSYNPIPSTSSPNCKNVYRRCCERLTADNIPWYTISGIILCQNDAERPQCREWQTLYNIATSKGFTDDPDSYPKPQKYIPTNGTAPLQPNENKWFNKANRVQKMKFEVAQKIKEHILAGGFLFAQCFAPESLDLALWQRAIYLGKNSTQAYEDCIAFQNFEYRCFPLSYQITNGQWYSTINTKQSNVFTLEGPTVEPRIQNHSNYADTGTGHTSSFLLSTLKPNVTILGRHTDNSNHIKYCCGRLGNGYFTYLGGHHHRDVYSKRLVLNNVLLGSLVEKDVNDGGTTPVVGKQKNNFGAIDPDNFVGGGANDYRNRIMFGYNKPLYIGDRIIPEPGNMSGPTDEGVSYRVFGSQTASPSRRIIVPITDIPPEVPINNPQNANALAIYDLQGQDHPNGAYRPDQYNFGSSVRIIGFAEFELLDPSEYTRAGNNILPGDNGDLGFYQSGQVRGKFIRYIVKPGEVPVN